MMFVEAQRLLAGHLFQLKETLMIRIAEEANLWLIKVSIMKSSYLSYIVGGPNFMLQRHSVRMLGGSYVSLAVAKKMRF